MNRHLSELGLSGTGVFLERVRASGVEGIESLRVL